MKNPTIGAPSNSVPTTPKKDSPRNYRRRLVPASLAAALLVGLVSHAGPVQGQTAKEAKELLVMRTSPDSISRGDASLNETDRFSRRESSNRTAKHSSRILQWMLSPYRLGRSCWNAVFHNDEAERDLSVIRAEDSPKGIESRDPATPTLPDSSSSPKIAPDRSAVVATMAVAPTYPLIALHSHTSGTVDIALRIDSQGSVISADIISGAPVLQGNARDVARRWKFNSSKDKNTIRTVRLTFVYRLVPKDTPADQLRAIFKPPYRMEVFRALPDETPLP